MARCFCHLHLHTHYSLLDGFNRIPPLVEQTKKLGMNACAITDHGNLYGAIEFYTECKKGGIKPIVGYEAYLAPNSRLDRDSKHELGHATHLTLLAKNTTGFKNLIKLSSIAYLEGFYRNPRIDRESLEAHSEGLICLSGCLAGEFNQYIMKGKPEEAERVAKWFRKLFGENFYIEIQNNGIAVQDECTPVAADISNKLGIPLVATADAHYLCAADARAHDVLFCVNTDQLHDPKKKKYPEERMPNPYYVRSPEDMYKLFPGYEEAVARSQQIADAVDIDLDFKKRHFPVFTPPESKSPEEFLRELCELGMKERYGDNPSEAVRKRLEHELGIICKMGFASYFLIVWDFVRFARETGIPCTARGSGCGAVVAYVLYLSHVCPLEYDLLFERFLDPNRSEAPDIDIDFCQDRRELVIEYVKQKYGEKSVAQIGTFGTLAAKAAIKDVGRVLGHPPERMNALCKLVPMKGAIAKSLQEALDESPDFRREYDQDPEIREVVDLALKLEGTNRNVGTHAAGVVIANGPITDYVPVQRPPKKGKDTSGDTTTMTTQWEMGILEKVGMLKMDFLGLRNLTVLDNCVKMIKRTRGENIDPMKFPLDDVETYKLLQRGDAKGVFQLESEGIRELLKRMKPDNIRDLIAVLALYRPGPLEGGMVDEYVECKHGRRQPVYPHPIVEEVLKETYGVMCIHEDTRVAMADGTEKPIKHMKRLDRVHSMNLETRAIEVKECHGCGPTRRETGLRLTLENGFSVLLTPDHKVWTWKGWKEVQHLDVETDLVACGLNTPQEIAGMASLAPWLGQDEDVAYLLGLLTGDGCLTSTGITIATGTEIAHKRIVAWIAERLPGLHVNEYFHLRSWYVNLSHPELLNDPQHGNRKTKLHHLIETLNLKTKATAKRVPEVIFRSPASARAAYLAGVLDSDGCITTNRKGVGVCFITSASRGLIEDLRRLCQLIGVSVKLYPQRLQVWNLKRLRDEVAPYLVVKSFPERCSDGSTVGWIPRGELLAAIPVGESRRAFATRTGMQAKGITHDFPFVKSSTARKAGIELGDVRFYRIERIEAIEDQQFYAMSVADHHNLLANGIVVKNCYQEQIMRMLNRMGGIELAKAYACIKAISKKKQDIIDERKADFINGCQERGMTGEKANEIFELIVKFGGYGFNKCVASETQIVDATTGEVSTVGDLFVHRRAFTIHALGQNEKLTSRAVTDIVWNGVKAVYRLKTQLGKTIIATANHPFRTLNGWTNLGDLRSGDRIAVPRQLSIAATHSWPKHELIALGGLLSEGNTCHPSTLYFYGNDRVLVEDFANAIRQFPDTVAKIYTRPGTRRLEVQANTGQDAKFKTKAERSAVAVAVQTPPKRSGAFRWAERLGILGKKATQKFIPPEVFCLCDADLELFLGRLWAGDGFIANTKLNVPFYATSSRLLAADVQHLLLRLGIVSRIHEKQFKYKGGLKPGFTVHLLGDVAAETFLERIAPHCVGREGAVELLREYIKTTIRGQTSKDTVPLEVRVWVDQERKKRGLTWAEVEQQSDVSMQEFYGTPSSGKSGFRRSTIAKLAVFFNSEQLALVANSDVFWDRVTSIEYVGERDTYDLTVEEDHNFVADGLIVHNSHTAAYAQIGYQTAYLKTHYTAEYMAALLSSEIDDGNKRDVFIDHISDARRLGIDVLPPDVNRGMADFDVQNNRIIFGLTAIKGLGRGAAEEIVRARTEGGKFTDLFDFCERVDRRLVQKAALEKMIQAGAFDGLGRRSAQFAAVSKAYQSAEERAAEKRRGQKSFLDLFESEGGDEDDSGAANNYGLPDVPEWPETERLKFEKEALDFYISSHPLAQHDEQLRRFRTHDAGDLARGGKNGLEARVGGMITNLDVRTANKGRNMGRKYAMFRIEDFTGTVRCIMWSDEYARFREAMSDDLVALFEGVLNWAPDRAEPDFQVKKVITIDEARREFTKSMVLKLSYSEDEETLRKLDAVSLVLKRYRGACPVYLSVRDLNGKQVQLKLNDEFRVNPAALKLEELEMLLGAGAVIFSR